MSGAPEAGNPHGVFVGQIVPRDQYHFERLRLVASLVPRGLVVHCPQWSLRTRARFLAAALADPQLAREWRGALRLAVARREAKFGLEMYRALAAANVTLNVHADSSPTHASNMRLFEATGVGSCLLTDWKENLHELFEIGREVESYRSREECIDKFAWLLRHPDVARQIGLRGQQRCLRDHAIERRALRLVSLLRSCL